MMTQFKEPRNHKKGTNIERKYHLTHDIVKSGNAMVQKVPSMENLVNPFSKTLMGKPLTIIGIT